MEWLEVDPKLPDVATLKRAADVLRAGGLVAFPTETVYGLGARALSSSAVSRIFAVKGRPGWNPLIAHVTDDVMARRDLVKEWPEAADRLARAFWPGPLTLVLPRRDSVPAELCAGLPSVAVRAPAHPVAQALIAALNEPVAAPSANPFQALSPTTAEHVRKGLGNQVDIILDGGPASVGVESTVVDLCGQPRILRAGGVSQEALARVLPEIGWSIAAPVDDGTARASPGMVQKHYAPKAIVALVTHGDVAHWEKAQAALPPPLGILSFSLTSSVAAHALRLPSDPASAQARLYAALHELEDLHCASILLEAPPEGAQWDALRDRMTRASG